MTTHFEHLRERARSAHNWTSFSPERRGDSLIQEASDELDRDLEEIKNCAIFLPEDEPVIAAQLASYKARFEQFLSAWIGAKSRCASSMIAGPSNFPVRRAQKANQAEQNRYQAWQDWRHKAKAAIKRSWKKEIDLVAKYKKELAEREQLQEHYKAGNRITSSKKLSHQQKVEQLVTIGISEAAARKALSPDFAGRIGFPSYMLTNNLANIKRLRERIAVEESKAQKAATEEPTEYSFEGGHVVLNYQDDRLQIFNDVKPPEETRNAYKSSGFRWSPSNGCWQRQLTQAAKHSATYCTGVKF